MHIKKLVIYGFKSFPRKTEVPFDQGINVILGPNGSGKSNIADALCFVLGRLGIKSMRAAKAKNLIFVGTKDVPPAKEAMVEMVFDNSDKIFSVNKDEVSIKRIVRRNGQSIYKINNETKTRQAVLTLLAQAGIDPNGFNIILQGQIQNLARMRTDDRRKIIEEVSGISVYEIRKEKSLHELEKTDEKLKEVLAILRERTAYLNNLEKERQQAMRFKKLEKDVKKFKASIIAHDLANKKKESDKINSEISKKNVEIEKIKKLNIEIQANTNNLEEKIKSINSTIEKATGFEQEKLNHEITELRAELAGLGVKIENYEARLSGVIRQREELKKTISENETSIRELQKKSPLVSKREKDLKEKKKIFEELERQRKKFYMTKSELKSIKERLEDKKNTLQNYNNESELLLKQIDTLTSELFDKKSNTEKLNQLNILLKTKKQNLNDTNKKQIEIEKLIYASEHEIKKLDKIKQDISKLDICPLCKSKITPEHIKSINTETNARADELIKKIKDSQDKIKQAGQKTQELRQDTEKIGLEISKRESDLVRISNIDDKKQQIKTLQEKIDRIKQEVLVLEKRKKSLEVSFNENSDIEQKYEKVQIEIQEISLRSQENLDSEILLKQRELERSKINLKQLSRDKEDLEEELELAKTGLEEKQTLLEQKNAQEQELSKKFEKLITQRDALQSKIREHETQLLQKQNSIHNIEQEVSELKIHKAEIDAKCEAFETDMLSYHGIEVIKISKELLVQKLARTEDTLSKIGTVNLRSLEIYDSIKKQYDEVKQKVETITNEKQGILKIIHEIDTKKKKEFNKTLVGLNEIFSRNFSQLSTKGQVFLEVENKKDPFESGSGVNIIIKTGKGKYMDVTSLSGGEQTIVALSLIFAIQEYRPYYFYILDEIDATLDKRNSERLAALLKKYMKKGQYLVITHNDEVITSATNIYGLSMHDGISKIVSLKV